jgi:hypothetical protein
MRTDAPAFSCVTFAIVASRAARGCAATVAYASKGAVV